MHILAVDVGTTSLKMGIFQDKGDSLECIKEFSQSSLSALYNTVKNDLTWNVEIPRTFGLDPYRLPQLLPSQESAGRMRPEIARSLGFRKQPPVIIGGNDAVLAAYDAGVREPGEAINVNGTCEITLVCLPRCLPSTEYNIRAHVLKDRWLTLYVMNMGSRYSLEPLKAEFKGMNQETTREELLLAMVRGLAEYQRAHLKEVALEVPLKPNIYVTGGAVCEALIWVKRKWMRDCSYIYREQSSLRGGPLSWQRST